MRGRFGGLADGEAQELGRHRLRVLETPHVHHWDSMMRFDGTAPSMGPRHSRGTITGDVLPRYVEAPRTTPFAFEGTLSGPRAAGVPRGGI